MALYMEGRYRKKRETVYFDAIYGFELCFKAAPTGKDCDLMAQFNHFF